MSEVKWTPAQKRAIDEGGNILVSAAAGSGKTATLSAKIMNILRNDDSSLDQFLIVTFTNAAAAELRERISREITKAAKTERSMMRHKRDVAGADICTIHSFCLKLVRRYFTTLGISPDFAIADETTAEVMKSRAMETTVDDFFRGDERITSDGACDVFTLADTVGKTKDTAGLDAELRSLSDRLDALGFDESYLRDCADKLIRSAEEDFFDSPFGEVIKAEIISAARHYANILDGIKCEMAQSAAVADKYMASADALSDYLERVISSGTSYSDMADAMSSYEPVTLGRLAAKDKTDASEEFKAVRDEAKKLFARLANKYFSSTPEQIADAMLRTAGVLRAASDVLAVYRERYSALKKERGVLDFSDLETLALKLLENEDGTPTAQAVEAGCRYRYVFIDEYQDTNSVQDRIFRAVSGSADKFFVGDIKQSIYRFRGAEPEVFSGYRRAWPEDERDMTESVGYPIGHSIFMSENFRCAKPVIDFVNAVSRYMFPHGGIPFTESDCLVYGGVAEGDVPVEVCLLDGSKAKADDDELITVSEAEYAADRIYDLIKNENYAPGDIAVLLRSANFSGGIYEAALKERGIPVKRAGGSSFADEAEVMLVLDILRAVDNPMKDVPLTGAMMSSVFGFTMDDLVIIRREWGDCPLYTSVVRYAERENSLGEKCRVFCEKLDALRCAERGMSADRFIEHLYAECAVMQSAEVTSKLFGEANLHMLHELARSYETGIFGGLYGFLAFVDEKLDSGALTSEGQNDGDGVTIISVHKSKGLEYKVCLLCECGKERNERDERERVLFDKALGIGLRLPDPGGLILCGNPIRDAIAAKMRTEGAMEEMRVLYVAMTRAKERLIVTAKCHGTPSDELALADRAAKYADSYSVTSSKRMIDHILGGVVTAGESVCTVTEVPKNYVVGDTEKLVGQTEEGEGSFSQEKIDEIKKTISFEYDHTYLRDIPSKLSVSALYPAVLDDTDDIPAVLGNACDDMAEAESEMPMPRFMTGAVDTSPAERGTSTHVFLQFADLQKLREGHVRDELDRLTQRGFITPKMASLVNRAQVEMFAASRVVERILTAPRMYREFRFNVLLPASRFTENDELRAILDETCENITVQGVFDCVFEDADGRLVLLDYKTDSMSYEERMNPALGRRKLLERHTRQLTYYAEAVRRLFGRAPDEVYIYSLALGEAIEVNVSSHG